MQTVRAAVLLSVSLGGFALSAPGKFYEQVGKDAEKRLKAAEKLEKLIHKRVDHALGKALKALRKKDREAEQVFEAERVAFETARDIAFREIATVRQILKVVKYGEQEARAQGIYGAGLARGIEPMADKLARAEADARIRLAKAQKEKARPELIESMEATAVGYQLCLDAQERMRQSVVLYLEAVGAPSLTELQRMERLQVARQREEARRRRHAESEHNRLYAPAVILLLGAVAATAQADRFNDQGRQRCEDFGGEWEPPSIPLGYGHCKVTR